MAKVSGDRNTCRGYGNCMIAAPSVFDVDDEGLVVVLKDTISDPEELGAAERAAYDCPTNSITLVQEAQ